ncbi:MAG: DUF2304 family protein [Nanoarchaeota archaeon]
MEYYHFIAIIFFLFAWSRAVLRFKDGKIGIQEFVSWTILWIGIGTIVILPQTVAFFSKIVGIQRPIDLFVYGSIIILFYLIFKIYVKLEGVERNITIMVRKEALRNVKHK